MKRFTMLLPNGSMEKEVLALLAAAGIEVHFGPRGHQSPIRSGNIFQPGDVAIKLRPWDAASIVQLQKAHLALAGDDLLAESGLASKLKVLDRYPLSRGGVGQTRVVLAVRKDSAIKSVRDLRPNHVVFTEYPRLAKRWLRRQGARAKVEPCHGSTEAFPSLGVADAVIENVETGSSLAANGLVELETIMTSQLCLVTSAKALANQRFRHIIEQVQFLLASVINARNSRLMKFNFLVQDEERILELFPGKTPTVSGLAKQTGFAAEIVVPVEAVNDLFFQLKKRGAWAIIADPIARLVA